MATRNDIAQRKSALMNDLRVLYHSTERDDSETAIRQRDLIERYGLSKRTISLTLLELVEEGVLYTVPRIGTFLGRPPLQTTTPYLFVSRLAREPQSFMHHLQIGFEDRIAQLGGSCLGLTRDEVMGYSETGNLPCVSGVFEMEYVGTTSQALASKDVPYAVFGESKREDRLVDRVDFDNEDGGAQATRHLLAMGHRQIAFLALHNSKTRTFMPWSEQREAGWRRVMQLGGRDVESLAFHPAPVADWQDKEQEVVVRVTAVQLLKRPEITAVIAANLFVAQRLLEALREIRGDANRWPAIVCFDSAPDSGASVVSYLRLPWEKIGSEAAQLLWERKTGRISGPAQRRLVSMQLIPRLSCRSDWAMSSTFVQSHIKSTSLELNRVLNTSH